MARTRQLLLDKVKGMGEEDENIRIVSENPPEDVERERKKRAISLDDWGPERNLFILGAQANQKSLK